MNHLKSSEYDKYANNMTEEREKVFYSSTFVIKITTSQLRK